MALDGIPISGEQCVGDSLVTINNAFSALDQRVLEISAATVTSVGLSSDGTLVVQDSPVTSSGTIKVSIGSVPLNKIASGGATTGQILGYDGSSWIATDAPTGGGGSGGGTVTSVSLSSDETLIIENSPITTFGTMKVSIGSVPLNKIASNGATGGQVLTYNSSTSTWVPSAVPGVTSVGISSDGTLKVLNTPITSSGTMQVSLNAVPLNKIASDGATGGQVLTYNSSTSTWVPSAAQVYTTINNTKKGTLIASTTNTGIWISLKSIMSNNWNYYFGTTPKNVYLFFTLAQRGIRYTQGNKIPLNSNLYSTLKSGQYIDISNNRYFIEVGGSSGNNNTVTIYKNIILNDDGDVFINPNTDGGGGSVQIYIGDAF